MNKEVKTVKKTIKVEDLDCANCAAKLEKAISGINGVTRVSVSFMAQKILLEADDERFDDIVKEIKKTAKKVVPDCTVLG